MLISRHPISCRWPILPSQQLEMGKEAVADLDEMSLSDFKADIAQRTTQSS